MQGLRDLGDGGHLYIQTPRRSYSDVTAFGDEEMAHQIKVLATKPDDLSSGHGTHIVRGEN